MAKRKTRSAEITTDNSESSRTEAMLRAIIDGTEYSTDYTQGENEKILQSIINNTEYTAEPQSRIAALLLELKKKLEA